MTSFTKILLILAAVVLLLVASADSIFQRWREQRLQEIHSKSMILETYLGKVEFADKRPQAPEEIKNSANLSQTPTVVVLHGGAGGYDQGLAVGDWLVNHNIRVLAISRPGYLQTPLQSGLFPEQQADLLTAFADKLSLPKPSLIAVAEAAPVALLAAWRYPNFFDKIILFSPIAIRRGFSEPGKFLRPAEAFLEFFTGDFGCWYRLLEFRWFPERLLYNFQILQNDQIPYECLQQARAILAIPEQKEWFSQWLLSCTPQSSREDGIRNDIVQIRGLPDIPFAEIKNPVLIFRGAKDKLTPAEDAEILARSLPNAVLLSIPQNGFLLPSVGQQSQKIMDSIVKFILEGNFPDLSIFQIEGNSRKVEEK